MGEGEGGGEQNGLPPTLLLPPAYPAYPAYRRQAQAGAGRRKGGDILGVIFNANWIIQES